MLKYSEVIEYGTLLFLSLIIIFEKLVDSTFLTTYVITTVAFKWGNFLEFKYGFKISYLNFFKLFIKTDNISKMYHFNYIFVKFFSLKNFYVSIRAHSDVLTLILLICLEIRTFIFSDIKWGSYHFM